MMDQRKTSGEYEETRVDCCTTLGVAGRGAITTTAAGCRRPDKHIATPQYRRNLRRGNARDILQRTHEPEHEWLWVRIERRVQIEQHVRIEQCARIERPMCCIGRKDLMNSSWPEVTSSVKIPD